MVKDQNGVLAQIVDAEVHPTDGVVIHVKDGGQTVSKVNWREIPSMLLMAGMNQSEIEQRMAEVEKVVTPAKPFRKKLQKARTDSG